MRRSWIRRDNWYFSLVEIFTVVCISFWLHVNGLSIILMNSILICLQFVFCHLLLHCLILWRTHRRTSPGRTGAEPVHPEGRTSWCVVQTVCGVSSGWGFTADCLSSGGLSTSYILIGIHTHWTLFLQPVCYNFFWFFFFPKWKSSDKYLQLKNIFW